LTFDGEMAGGAEGVAAAASPAVASDFGAFGGGVPASDFGSDFGAFGGGVPGLPSSPVAVPLAADFGAFGSAAPSAPAAAVPRKLSADFGAFGSSEAPSAPVAAVPLADFGAFGSAAADSSAWGAFESVEPGAAPAAAAADWGFQATPAVQANDDDGFGDFGFDDEKASPAIAFPAISSSSAPAEPLTFDEPHAPTTSARGSAAGVASDTSWGAFGDFDNGGAFKSAPPALVSPASAKVSSPIASFAIAPPTRASPSSPSGGSKMVAPLSPPGAGKTSTVEHAAEEDCGPIDEEHRKLAEALAGLGLFEEAAQCQDRGARALRLQEAEDRKKAAVMRDDFEGAITIRGEIQTLATELGDNKQLEVWKKLVAGGERDASLEAVSTRLRERCQYLVDAASRSAMAVAVGNFRSACPATGVGLRLAQVPALVRRQRRAWQMSRAIEAVGASDVLLVLQVLLVCLGAMGELLGSCAGSLKRLASPEMTSEERKLITEADEFKSLLRGLGSLRRLHWRFGLSAELFLPSAAASGRLGQGRGRALGLAAGVGAVGAERVL